MEIHQILSHFADSKQIGGGGGGSYQVKCPCHNDKKSSLTVTERDGKILMHCHAGCHTEDIVTAIGLSMSDLCGKKNLPIKKGWRDRLNVEAVYDYGAYIKIRQKEKVIRYGRVENDKFISGMPEGVDKTIYRLKEMQAAIKNGYPIYYVEGEKDADNLAKLGLTACTAGGCGDWKTEFVQYFRGAKVVILPDNDEPGQALAQRIARDIKNVAYSIKTVTVSEIDKGDVSDYLACGGTKESLLGMVDKADTHYADWVKLQAGKPNGIYTDILAHAISKDLDYVIINRAGLDIAEFYVFKGGVYKKCSKNEAKGWIKDYLPLGVATDNMLNNVYNLLLCSPQNTYGFADINVNERIINVKNGILDLKTRRLEKHNPKVLSTLQLNCNFDKNAECPQWEKYINTLCSDSDGNVDCEKVNLLQEWTGLLLSNVAVNRTKKCLVLTSPLGNTGKSVFLNVLEHFIGIDNVANIPIQNMSDRFALGDLCGKRLDIVGDQKSDDILDSSVFKQLTGGDSVKIEFKGKQAFNWHFSGGIVMACNALPAFTDDKGGHMFERFNIIPCEKVIAKENRDGGLAKKLCKEADGIFNWAIEGLYRLRDNDFKFSRCRADEATIDEYRERLDTLYSFVKENYTLTQSNTDRVKKTDFEDWYIKWCNDNELTPLNKKNIKDRAAKNGIGYMKSCGSFYYTGIQPVYIATVSTVPPKVFEQLKF